jgi:hypothetical protein
VPSSGLLQSTVCARNTALAVGIGLHNARTDRKAFTTHQAFGHATVHHAFKHVPEHIALAETAVPVLREARVIGNLVLQPKSAEPAIRQVQMHFLAQPAFRTDAKAVADQQRPHHELQID